MNTYNKLYFLHIPKNGGRYIIYNVLDPIREQLEQNNIKILNPKKFDHSNWHSKIDDQTYVISVLREPSSQIISLYVHEKTTDIRGRLITNKDFILSKRKFYKEIIIDKNYQNFQSKSFMRNEFGDFGLRGPKTIIDNELLEKRINRVNLLLNNNDLKQNAIKIQQKIFLDLGIDGLTKIPKVSGLFYNPHSEYFYDQFLNLEKDLIAKYNKIDNILYKNANYYTI
jgi:hypothetical protein